MMIQADSDRLIVDPQVHCALLFARFQAQHLSSGKQFEFDVFSILELQGMGEYKNFFEPTELIVHQT